MYLGEIGTATATSAVSSLAIPITTAAAAGHTIVGGVSWESSAAAIPAGISVADDRGNSWAVEVSAGGSGNATVAVAQFRSQLTTGLQVGDHVTISIGETRTRWAAVLEDFDDGIAASPLDQTVANDAPGAATALTSGVTADTTQPSELLVATFGFPAARGPVTPGTGWDASTLVETAAGSANRAVIMLWKYATETGPQEATATLSSSGTYAGGMATYKTTAAPVANIAQVRLSVPNPGQIPVANIAQVRFAAPRPATGSARIAQVHLTIPAASGQRPPSGIKVLSGGALWEAGLYVARDGEI